jgi:diguanylate cyclase (GGDEF)-like protein
MTDRERSSPTRSRPRVWQIGVTGGGVALMVAAGWLTSPMVAAVAAAGGGLLAIGLLWFGVWGRAAPESAPDAGRLEAMTNALLEGVLDLYSLVEVRHTGNARHFDRLMTTTLHRVAQTTDIESYAFFVLEPERNVLVAKIVGGAVAQELERRTFESHEGLAARVCRTKLTETHRASTRMPWPDVPPGARSVCAVPLAGKDRVLGALMLYSASPSAFSKREQIGYFVSLGRQLSTAVDNAMLHLRAMDMSYHDTLTDLFNRRYLDEALESEIHRAARYGLGLSVNMIDIDRFKEYNDAYGHTRGDEILRMVAQQIREHTRRADILIRYGGEEFVAILPKTTKTQGKLVAEKLRAAVAATVIDGVAGRPCPSVTISVGVASFPDDSSTAIGLLQAADAALYAAKDLGRNRVEVFNERPADLG